MSKWQLCPRVMATDKSKLTIWQKQDVQVFSEACHRDTEDQFFKISVSGGLIYRYRSYKYHYKAIMIEICNPITKGYRRLDLPRDDQGLVSNWSRDANFCFWGIIVEHHLNRYQVIVQNWTRTESSEPTISRLLVYDSASELWETVGPLPQGISSRIGDYIYSSTSSGGNPYFLTNEREAGVDVWHRIRLFKYDGKEKTVNVLSMMPTFAGNGMPLLLEHRGDIIILTKKRIQHNGVRRTTWGFFILHSSGLFVNRLKSMPLDGFTVLSERTETVRCQGNGDLVYFFGSGKGEAQRNVNKVVVHDLARNSWTWLPDFSSRQEVGTCNIVFCDLVSIQPSFMKV